MMWGRAKKVKSGYQNVNYEDTTMGLRRLAADDPGVATIPVVLDMAIQEVSWISGLDQSTPFQGTEQGFRDGLIMPSGRELLVLVLIYPEQSVSHRFGVDESQIAGQRIGHFSAQERRRWQTAFDGRNVKGVLFIDVPAETVEFRFRPDRIGEGPVTTTSRETHLDDPLCGDCGVALRPGVSFCTHCGSPQDA